MRSTLAMNLLNLSATVKYFVNATPHTYDLFIFIPTWRSSLCGFHRSR